MSQYLVLSHIDVQNANSIAGLTWGFPAITGFLGFTHALSRKLSADYDFNLSGCAIVSNRIHNKVYQPKAYADFEFLQSKNPPVLAKHKNSSPPIIEEGKMNLTVSLVIELDQELSMTNEQIKQLENHVGVVTNQMRMAGGAILNIRKIKLFSASTPKEHITMLSKIKRLVMPGFVLLDKSHYLKSYYCERKAQDDSIQLLDVWLDFSALRFKSVPKASVDQDQLNEQTPAEWEYQPKPQSGWLVPLMTGYKAISDLYEPEEVLNVRDSKTPTRFVEAIHSVGEWKGAHSLASIEEVIWRYEHDGQWYCCAQSNQSESKNSTPQKDNPSEFVGLNNSTLQDALNDLFDS